MANILIIDDDPLNRKYLSLILSRFGMHKTRVGRRLSRIVKDIEAGRVDLLLIDASATRYSDAGDAFVGPELCRFFRSQDTSPQIPVVLMFPANTSENLASITQTRGANAYIQRPIRNPQAIVDKIARILHEKPIRHRVYKN